MSEIFWTFCITSGIGLIVTLAKMGYKSKCKECSCCCIKVIRDTDLEEKELEFQVRNGLPPVIDNDLLPQQTQNNRDSWRKPKKFPTPPKEPKQNNSDNV